ncbi:uncharacterized protein LOC119425502 [Nematolebias whitei]|uniref:uncharacterized protein LOC119425502 n=1 Tax=Nematolebias whitei TaxID=451745 RepID=UPI00189A851E|nr:uncharacterized protein LOC119425502 [Nematolebias whitei]
MLVRGAVLLLLLAAFGSNAAPPPAEDCANVTKRLPTKDLHEIFDHWVLVWSVSDHDVGHGLLAKLSSSHVEFKLDNDNKTIDIIERNRLVERGHHDTCTTYFTKTTMPSDDAEHHTIKSDNIKIEKNGIPHEYNDIGEMDFYQTCSDCLLMIYKTSKQQYLLVYRREGSHLDVEQHKADHDDHKKLAECLGFPHHQPFIYNGKADFCHKLSIPISEECQPIVTPLSLDDPSVIFGNWVLVWSVSDHDEGHSLLASVSSSHVEFKALHDNQGVEFIERNIYLGSHDSCTVYYSNLTKATGDADQNTLKTSSIRKETDGVVQEYNDTGVVDFYKTCADCLLMNYKTSTHRYLLFYKKEGSHQDVEQHKTHHDDHKKLAECLRFPHHQPFIYNGKADFCHKKSAPEANPEQFINYKDAYNYTYRSKEYLQEDQSSQGNWPEQHPGEDAERLCRSALRGLWSCPVHPDHLNSFYARFDANNTTHMTRPHVDSEDTTLCLDTATSIVSTIFKTSTVVPIPKTSAALWAEMVPVEAVCVCFSSRRTMSLVKGAVLLLLLAACKAVPPPPAEDCANVTKRLPTKDLHEIFDHWVLVWSVSDHDVGHDLLAKLSSSHVEFKLNNDNKTIDYNERHRFVGHHDTCTTYFNKMAMPSDDAEHHSIKSDTIKFEKNGIPHEFNDTGAVDFYQTCSDCLLMIYKTSAERYLLVYRREGSHLDVEQHKADHDDHKKLAECLGFPHHQPFIYNGKADFCHKLSIPISEECQPIVTPLFLDDPSVIFGDWVLVWSVSDDDEGHSLLARISSIHVEFKALHVSQGVEFIERNVYLGSHDSCTVYYSNMTKATGDADQNTLKTSSIRKVTHGVVQEFDDTGVVHFYKSCSDCLLMTYKTSTHRYLLIFKKEGSHQDVEQNKTHHDDHKKLAECLRFPHHQPFIYNGKADFCHKKSAPEANPEQS